MAKRPHGDCDSEATFKRPPRGHFPSKHKQTATALRPATPSRRRNGLSQRRPLASNACAARRAIRANSGGPEAPHNRFLHCLEFGPPRLCSRAASVGGTNYRGSPQILRDVTGGSHQWQRVFLVAESWPAGRSRRKEVLGVFLGCDVDVAVRGSTNARAVPRSPSVLLHR